MTERDDRMTAFEKRLDAMGEDVRVLKDDVRALKDDVGVLKDDVRVLKDDVRELKGDVRGLRVLYEHHDSQIRTIAEVQAQHGGKLDEHGRLLGEIKKELAPLGAIHDLYAASRGITRAASRRSRSTPEFSSGKRMRFGGTRL